MASDPLILGFDTTAAHCAAVLLSGDRVVAEAREEMSRGQAERLVPLLQAVLSEAGATAADLSALGVGVGPGNFTGTRIAVATARGLALARGIPAVGVSGLEALALGADGAVLASLDARKGRAYIRGFGCAPRETTRVDLAALEDGALPSGTLCLGDHAAALADATRGHAGVPRHGAAEAIARIAAARHGDAGLARPAPLYLRPPVAAPAADPPPALLP